MKSFEINSRLPDTFVEGALRVWKKSRTQSHECPLDLHNHVSNKQILLEDHFKTEQRTKFHKRFFESKMSF